MACLLRYSTSVQAATWHRAVHALACPHYPAPLQKTGLNRSAPGIAWRNSQSGSQRCWTSWQTGGRTSSSSTAAPYSSNDINVNATTGSASTGVDASTLIPTASKINQIGVAPVAAKTPFYYLPVAGVQGFLVYLHLTQGLPPWACFASLAVLARVCTFPLQVGITKASLTLNNYSPQLQEIQGRMMAVQQHDDIVAKIKVQKDLQELYKEMGCKPFSVFTRIIPLAVTQAVCFLAIRDLCKGNGALELAGLSSGGCLWFTDLTVSDPLFLLPTTLGLLVICSTYLGSETGVRPEGALRNGLMILAGVCAIFTAQFPAALQLFWTTNVFCSIIISRVIRHPQFRKWAGIPVQVHHDQSANFKNNLDKMMAEIFPRKK